MFFSFTHTDQKHTVEYAFALIKHCTNISKETVQPSIPRGDIHIGCICASQFTSSSNINLQAVFLYVGSKLFTTLVIGHMVYVTKPLHVL